jgi:IS605 OrfB family transposase
VTGLFLPLALSANTLWTFPRPQGPSEEGVKGQMLHAEENKSAVVLEDLKGVFKPREDKALNRRLSMWPRRKLHQFIEYKARWRGIPVHEVDPRNSSRKCPMCGTLQDSRKGTEFACECGWHLDRHINARLNLLHADSRLERDGGGSTVRPRRAPA